MTNEKLQTAVLEVIAREERYGRTTAISSLRQSLVWDGWKLPSGCRFEDLLKANGFKLTRHYNRRGECTTTSVGV